VGDPVAVDARLVQLPRGDRQVLPPRDPGQYFFGHVRF
jgi:hypothetical protein